MDIAQSLTARTDQINAEDLAVTGPQTYTIREVVDGKAEQPYDFLLVETDRAWRPPVTMRRLVAAAWETTDGKVYEGRRVTLFCDPDVRFGKETPGGVRISHMSHLAKRWQGKIKNGRGKRETFTVEPLIEEVQPTPMELAAQVASALNDATTEAEVREWGNRAASRNLLDMSPAGSTGTLRELVESRLAEVASIRADGATGGDS